MGLSSVHFNTACCTIFEIFDIEQYLDHEI